MKKFFKTNSIVSYAMLILVVLFGVAYYVDAGGEAPTVINHNYHFGEGVTVNFDQSSQADDSEEEVVSDLGGSTQSYWSVGVIDSTEGTDPGDVNVGDDLVVDDDFTSAGDFILADGTNQTKYFYEVIDFTDATITPALFDPNALGYDDFYLMDLWVENTGKATTSIRMAVVTTTETFISGDDITTLTDDAGAAALLKTLGNAFGADGATFDSETATSSAFSLLNYPGDETRVADGTMNLLINSTTNIAVFATSSDFDGGNFGILGTGNTFDGKLHIIGKKSNR